jgi:hypothetical protein
MIDDSDIFRLCDDTCVTIGSCFSIRGEFRGEAVRKEFEMAEEGVGSKAPVFGERLTSIALDEIALPAVADAGVVSGVLLVFELSLRGAGDPLRSIAGDLGGTWGGSTGLVVFNFSGGFAPGLRIGDNGLPVVLGDS